MPKAPSANTQERDERAFNETLKRMLETPPKPHDKGDKPKGKAKPKKEKPAK